jgi:hypothetical protein
LWDQVQEVKVLMNEHTKAIESMKFLVLMIWRHLGLPEDENTHEPKPLVN